MGYGDLRKGRRCIEGQEYLVTTVCSERRPVFSNATNMRLFVAEIRRLETQGDVDWLAWIVMPNHFHGLLRLKGNRCLPDIMRLLKGRSARALGGPTWQEGFHDHALRKEEDRCAVARYLLANPVRAGIAVSLRDYPYWHCTWLAHGDNPDLFLEP
ncbi:MAG: transposase [Gammaproteobacteria bacterium]|nr:transposase [Gammaproteobacteria bacterium]